MSSMGELTFFLGLQVTQKYDGIFISQDKYVDEILKKFGFLTVKTASTPMETSKPLLKDAKAEDVDVHLYRSMIGSLMYLTASRPDIMFAVCSCARFKVTSKVSHLHAVKRIFGYLKGQPKLGLWYPKDSPFDLEACNDSDFAVQQDETVFKEWKDRKNEWAANTAFCLNQSEQYALTVNPTIYTTCIEQFWVTAKVKTVNGDVFANMKREGKGFSGKVTPLFQTMIVQAPEDMEPIPDEATNEEPISTPSCDPPQSGKDRLQLTELMSLCTSLQEKVLDLEEAKTAQAKEIASLKRRVKQLEKRRKSRTLGLKRLRKVGKEVGAEKEVVEKQVSAADPVTTAGKVVTTANVEVTTVSAPTTTIDKLTLAQTLIEIKAAKPKAVTTAATITTTTRPKARGVVVQEPSEFKTTSSSSQASQLPQVKDKGKAKMVKPEKPSKKKDHIALDEELALRLHAEEQAELERMQKEKVTQEEASRAAIIKELDSIQAMTKADEQLAARLQDEEQEQFSIEEKSRMLVEMIAERKNFFAAQRAAEQISKPHTKTQIRNRMCAYLKNMGGYKHNQLKGRSYEEIQNLFDKAYKQVNSFVLIDLEVVKSSVTRTEGSSKRARDELESDKSKKHKIDKHVEAKKGDDQEGAEMKKHIEIVKDDEVVIDAIPLATKPPMIVEYKINIDREDLENLWKLVKAKHGNTRPEEDYERIL
ncbi:hypothetical protein Tco_0715709 [Tanacetum coccineum]